jgi:5-(carboxyamino)imidazole ribonucleotide synthase
MTQGPVVGILGGGQLGRMLALSAVPLGLRVVSVDPEKRSPASWVSSATVADYGSEAAFAALAQAEVITYEFENVPVEVARALEHQGLRVAPGPRALEVAQDRLVEKRCFQELGIPTVRFAEVASSEEARSATASVGLPAVLKTRRLGYDGKGQRVVRTAESAAAAWEELGRVPCILEEWLAFERELSVVAARGLDGSLAVYPVAQNEHRDGILRTSTCPAHLTAELESQAKQYAERLLQELDYVGVLALELFERQGVLYANEFAPRVHNSGHHTIEGCETSQFENHLRAILGWPLGDTRLRVPCAMVNLIGNVPPVADLLAIPGAHLHLYGKAPRRARKLGHVTLLAHDEALLRERLADLKALVARFEDG